MIFPEQHLGHHVGPIHPELPPYEDADMLVVMKRLGERGGRYADVED